SQNYSITEMLDAGFRQFELDVYTDIVGSTYPRLCHGACSSSDRYFSSVLKELRDWMKEPGHEREVVALFVESHIEDAKINQVDASIKKILADDPAIGVYTKDGPEANNGTFPTVEDSALGLSILAHRWPTKAEMLAAG